jgi:hypothetical protein
LMMVLESIRVKLVILETRERYGQGTSL